MGESPREGTSLLVSPWVHPQGFSTGLLHRASPQGFSAENDHTPRFTRSQLDSLSFDVLY